MKTLGDTATLVAREYLRVSYDTSGRERSNDEQHADNERDAAGRWTLGAPYRDTGSASRYARKARDDFPLLLEDLRAEGPSMIGGCRFNAHVLVLWESSRGSRRVGEWVELIELCERRGVRISVTTHGRLYDPTNPRDRRSLLEDAVDSEYESGKLSARVTRSMAANAADGRPHGRIPYGYRRVYDPSTGRLVGQEPHEREATVVRELFDRVARGHSFRSIARDFEARGIRSRSGKVFSPQHLRSLCLADVYRAKRIHIAGRRSGKEQADKTRVEFADGQWPALVDDRTWLAVQRTITDPARVTTRAGRAVHLLSMIARCDVCSGPLAATNRGRGRQYQCHVKGCVRVDADELDGFAVAAMLGYLSRLDNVERLTRDDGDDGELAGIRDDIAAIRAELDDLADQLGRGEISAALAARAEPAILARLERAEAREAELSTPSALRGLIKPGDDVAGRWDAAPMSAKREIARLLLASDILGELRVTRSPSRGHRVPVVERITWTTSDQPS